MSNFNLSDFVAANALFNAEADRALAEVEDALVKAKEAVKLFDKVHENAQAALAKHKPL